jgi:type IV secretory pathway protease TraF
LIKPIAAQPGDTIEISNRSFVVNGKALPNSAPLNVDTEEPGLQHWPIGNESKPERSGLFPHTMVAVSIRATSAR